ncbi:unnamed protein product [Darwinula stevensoni]|uniref:Protein-S-isoprenylcysteine O-methyltransferase n=1 Tax=Darwinula stevensoni TaxID=69355 RepID=A0A7R8XAR7_9CRUS|nr:unnamed protein product [Darwinula stevensoni]CAG0892180.1 unnamed protein product [Darwinula stevensoni]
MKLVNDERGRTSVLGFLAGFVAFYGPVLGVDGSWTHRIALVAVSTGVLLATFRYFLSTTNFQDLLQIGWRGGLLGLVFAVGTNVMVHGYPTYFGYGSYLAFLSFFHFSEYVTTSLIKPASLSLSSYLLNHSRAYHKAAVASWTEFFLEVFFFPGMKHRPMLWILGSTLCLIGEGLRKAAMFTAGSNFDHVVQEKKEEGHALVTSGVYALCRHPSYLGWFLWSIGTQVLLCNPLCTVGYAVASWNFFASRIYSEEITLIDFFGEDYLRYQERVPSGVPFIKGFQVSLQPELESEDEESDRNESD